LDLKHHGRKIYVRIFPEVRRQTANFTFPCGAVKRGRRQRFAGVGLRGLFRKVRRFVFFFGTDRGIRFHVQERRRGALVFAIGELPEYASNPVRIVAQGQGSGGHATGAALAVGIVERRGADSHGDVRLAALQSGVGEQASVRTDQHDDVLVIDSVA
jgi:hypothetical protein